jgi:hypothetical protein
MIVRDPACMFPRVRDVLDDYISANAVFNLSKHEWPVASHFSGIAIHHVQIGANGVGEVGLVNYEQVGLGDTRSTFARYFVTTSHIDDLNRIVREFPAKAGSQIVPAGFDQQNVGREFSMQGFEREQISGNVFADCRVRATSGFDGANSLWFQGLISGQKLRVFLCKNVIGDNSDAHGFSKRKAKLKH